MTKSPGKKIKNICLNLGKEYSIKVIDKENTIYRDLGNGFEFEISGLDNQTQSINASIYIWQTKTAFRVVEKIHNINSITQLENTLENLVDKYLKNSIPNLNSVKN